MKNLFYLAKHLNYKETIQTQCSKQNCLQIIVLQNTTANTSKKKKLNKQISNNPQIAQSTLQFRESKVIYIRL